MKKPFKALYRMRYLPLVLVPLLVALMVLPGTLVASGAGGDPVPLGTAGSFAVLAYSGITNTGATTIDGGDVGSEPTPSETGFDGTGGNLVTITNGTNHPAVDTVTQQAQDALSAAIINAKGRSVTSTIDTELGGHTYKSGVYDSLAGDFMITGTLTLDAENDPNAVFIFKMASTLGTAVGGSVVSLINGAQSCNVFWQVGSSATLNAGNPFVGTIMATTSISVGAGVTIYGRLLAEGGAVTLINDTITVLPCSAAAIGGILTIYKVDSSGNPIVAYTPALAASFNIYTNSALGGSPIQAGSIIKDTNFFRTSLPNGTFYVVETSAPEGYSRDSTVRSVTMSGGNATVTFVNTTGASGAATTTTAVEVAAEEEESTSEATAATATTASVPVTTTVTGGKLPKTGTPWYNLLLAGIALILIGAIVWISRKVYAKRSKT